MCFFAWFGTYIALQEAEATPLIALRESHNCGGCHNPGRGEVPLLDRRCTLDCSGCHVDPNGAGPRNQWGYYYTHDQLPVATFFKPIDPLKDDSRFDVHGDSRLMNRAEKQHSRTFLMNNEIGVRVRPFIKYLHLVYQFNVLGRPDYKQLNSGFKRERGRIQEKFAVMVDNLPLALYVRAARGTPVYGQRRPNHSAWIRERIGLGQFASTDSVSFGGNPTVPFMHFSYMNGDSNALPEDRQKGYSFHGGMRGVSYGWHVNGSVWSTASEKAAIDMRAFTLGANIFDFVVMAEKNWRTMTPLTLTPEELISLKTPGSRVYPSSVIQEVTLSYAGIRGLMPGFVYETLNDPQRKSVRQSFFFDFHPIPFVQIEYWNRHETGTRNLNDQLILLHLYGDY